MHPTIHPPQPTTRNRHVTLADSPDRPDPHPGRRAAHLGPQPLMGLRTQRRDWPWGADPGDLSAYWAGLDLWPPCPHPARRGKRGRKRSKLLVRHTAIGIATAIHQLHHGLREVAARLGALGLGQALQEFILRDRAVLVRIKARRQLRL